MIAGVAIILPLMVSTYARTEPLLWGIPFFFWYQFVLVLVSMILTSFAFRLVMGHERQRRAFEGRTPGSSNGSATDGNPEGGER